jgi:glutamate synthase (NADPH/NADH) small chain
LEGVVDAVSFIAEYKTGTPRVGRRVAVVGGGNTAIDAACAAKRLGAEEVTVIYRRGEGEMPAFAFEYEHAKRDAIRFLWRAAPVAIHGGPAVERLEHSSGELFCDMVILSIGQSKLFQALAGEKQIVMENGRITVDRESGQTTNPRYYAAGDCVNGGREVVDAVAGGTRAGRAISARLKENN